MSPISSWGDTLNAIQQRQVYDQRVQAAQAGANPQLAAGVVAHATTYPWMAPQTAYALAANGNQPGDPLSQAVATASVNKKGGGFWHPFGAVVDAATRAAIHLGSDLQGAGKVAARSAFTGLNSLYEVPMGALRDVANATGDIGAGIASGAAIGAGTGLAFGGIGALPGAIGGAVIGGVAGLGAQAKGVEVKGGFVNPLAQSAGTLAIGNLVSGNKVDLGTGFMPGGTLSAEATKNMQDAASINGHALTPGRMVASGVWRPGTGGYNILSGVADGITRWELDPGRYLTEQVGAQVRAAKVLPGAVRAVEELGSSGKFVAADAGPLTRLATRMGILDSADPAFNSQVAKDFLTTDPAARAFVTKAAETPSAAAIREATNGKLPSALLNQLAAHTTEQGVVDTILSHMESQGLRERAAVQTGGGRIASAIPTFRPPPAISAAWDRATSVLPAHSFDLRDIDKPGGAFKLDNAVNQMDNLLKQARYTVADRAPILDRLMATTTADEAKQVITETIHGDLRTKLLAADMPEEVVNRVLHTTAADRNALLSQVHSEVAGNQQVLGLTVGEDRLPLNGAADVMADDATHVRVPDARDVRRMTTPSPRLKAIYNSRPFLETEHAADAFMGGWKKLNLQRVALPLRMVAMAQAKMGANGLETPMADPINMFARLIGRSPKVGALEGLVEGSPLSQAEEMMGMSRRMSGLHSADDLAAHQTILKPGDDGFARAWSARVAEQHANPLARTVADGGIYAEGTGGISRVPTTVEGAPAYMQPGTSAAPVAPDLFGERINVAPRTGRVVESARTHLMSPEDAFWDGPHKALRLQMADDLKAPELLSREGADAHVAQLRDDLRAITSNDPNLMEAVATGKLGGTDLLKAHPGGLVNPDLEVEMQRLVANPDIEVPNQMKAAKPSQIDPDYGNKVGRVTQAFYSNLVGKPMNALVNHPMFNQLYWSAVADHASMLSEDGQAALRSRLESGSKLVRPTAETETALLDTLKATATPGANTIDDVDKLARAQAIQKLQDMTIDMSKKQGWQDSMRHIMPFAKHWQQETGQWARLLTAHPEAFQKAQMAVHGAEGAGWFHRNDQGALVFNYPGSGLVSKVLTGVEMPITGKVGGFSTMTTDLFPGFGPGVSILASKLIPNKPEFDSIRSFLSPYGDPTQQGVAAAVLPAWAKTLQTALSDPQNDRDAANTTMQVAKYLVSTGKYTMDSPENVTKTLDAAGSRAKHLLELQALGKFVLPASPTMQPMAMIKATGDKDGRTVVARTLSDDLVKMRKDDYENSTQNFIDKYGENALLYLQSATRPIVAGAAGTKEQETFARANPDLVKAFPNSYAFFADQGAQTPDFNTITRQIHTGERQALTPAQQVAMANDQVGSMIYYNAKAKLGTRIGAPQQAWLATLRDGLVQKYPGFGVPIAGIQARVTDSPQGVQDVVLPELRKALDDPKLAGSDTGRALAQYMQLRDGIDKIGQSRGLKPDAFSQSPHAIDLRAVLNKAASVLGEQAPGFSMMFDRLLSRELRTDTQPTPAVTSV